MRLTRLHPALGLLLLAGTGGTELAAQPAIAVTADAHADADARQQIDLQTRAISRQHDRQLARFEQAVCISVHGLAEPYARMVLRRMVADAARAGVKSAKPGCKPNIVILVADHVQDELQRLSRHDGAANSFGLDEGQLAQMASARGPAYAATVTSLRSRDGDVPRPAGLSRKDTVQLIVNDASIVAPPTRQDIDAAVLLLDSSAIPGKSVTQIADYAAFTTLADVREEAGPLPAPTILTLFHDKAPATGLTAYDRAYLAGLYRGSAAITANAKMQEITSAVLHQSRN